VPLEIGLWRVDGKAPAKVSASRIPLESRLEELLESDPAILGEPLLLIGRQVPTAYGTFMDLLAVDSEGTLHVLELKRERTPREVVAQVLDYGSWVARLTHDEVLDLFAAYRSDVAFEQAFADHFGDAPPAEVNVAQRLTVVASDVDPATERIVSYLNSGFGVPVNVVFFRYFEDDGREYLARTWLIDEATAGGRPARTGATGSREVWNGQDWYVSFGEESSGRVWEDGRRYGFVSAGGSVWFSRTLRALPVGARVFTCIPKQGYVGVGVVAGQAQRFDDAVLTVDGTEQKLADLELKGSYHHTAADDDETAEYVVPVKWLETRAREEALWQRGMFANQNAACKLRNKFTIDTVTSEFNLAGDEQT
jgi:hypothetical protein